MMPSVLVVGGAGYIGSHMVKRLGQVGCKVTSMITFPAVTATQCWWMSL